MNVLNLYAGLGGNRKHWSENIHVTAVENNPAIAAIYKELFPDDTLIVGDAHEYLLNNFNLFDMVWSSPPCQSHSRMVKATRHKSKRYPDMTLYQEIIFLKHFFYGKWVVENVIPYYKPLIKPTAIIGRHYFWSNFPITHFTIKNFPSFITADTPTQVNQLKEWLGIHYEGNLYYNGNHSPAQVLRNCVHPDLGNHVLKCAMNITTLLP